MPTDWFTIRSTLNHNTHCEVASVSNLLRCETNSEAFKCKCHHILPRPALTPSTTCLSRQLFTVVRFNYSCNCPIVTET